MTGLLTIAATDGMHEWLDPEDLWLMAKTIEERIAALKRVCTLRPQDRSSSFNVSERERLNITRSNHQIQRLKAPRFQLKLHPLYGPLNYLSATSSRKAAARFLYFGKRTEPIGFAACTNRRKWLDVGCRDATLSAHFLFCEIIEGIDVDPNALDEARKRLPSATFQLVDVLGDWHELAGETFDIILCSEVLEHLYFPERVVRNVRII